MKIEVIQLFEGVSNASLTAYLQDPPPDIQTLEKRPAVIICPGGAFIGITEKEAEPVAVRFLSAGYQAFVLRYSIGAGLATFPAPFIDAAKAVMTVREKASIWSVDPDNISLCGFSAGGYVAAALAATWHEEYLAAALNTDNNWFRPNALILGYSLLDLYRFKIRNQESHPERQPVLEMFFGAAFGTPEPSLQRINEWNLINRVTSNMPKTFLWMLSRDSFAAAEDGLEFVKALADHDIPYEFHIFEKGAHGLSLGDTDTNARKWVDLALDWLGV